MTSFVCPIRIRQNIRGCPSMTVRRSFHPLRLQELLPGGPTASITYFVQDERKNGGSYQTVTRSVKRIDAVSGMIQMTDRQLIPIADVFSIEIIP